MIALVRRDPAFRAAPVWALMAGLNAGVVCGVLTAVALRFGTAPSSGMIVLAIWLSVGAYLLLGAVNARATEHELALPLSGRRLWVAHGAAVAVGCLAIVAMSALLIVVLARLVTPLRPVGSGVPGATALLVVGSLLAVALVEVAGRGSAEVTGGRNWTWRVAVVLALGLLLPAVARHSWISTLTLFVLAAAAWALAARGVPSSLDLAPRVPQSAPRAPAGAPAAPAGRKAPRLSPLLFRWVPPFARYGWVVFAALLGFVLAGGTGVMSSDEDLAGMRLFYFYLVAYMLVSTNGPLLRPLRFLDPLPVARGRVLAGLFLPPAVAVAAGVLLGAVISGTSVGLMALELALAVTIWLISLAALLSAYRPGVPDWVRRVLYWGPLAVLLVLPMWTLFSAMSRRTKPFLGEAGLEAALLQSIGRPGWAVALAAAAVAVVALAAWLALRQFRRMEIPLRAVRYELVEWACEDR